MGNINPCPNKPIVESEYIPSSDPEPLPDNLDKLKFLLLGAGESGKSTLYKQMRINYVNTYSTKELHDEKVRIIRAIHNVFKNFLKTVKEIHGLGENIEMIELADELFPEDKVKFPNTLSGKVVKFMKAVWYSDNGQAVWRNEAKYPFSDSLAYFMEDLDRFFDKGYKPTEADYLKTRVKTTGIHEQTFIYKGVTMTVVDVGGQRNERNKWLKCLDGVTAVFFVASLSSFDETLYEKTDVKRLPEALELFKKVLGFLPFRLSETPFVLFLNKEDVLEEKLMTMEKEGVNLDKYFPELKLGTNYDNAALTIKEHIRDLFLAQCTEQQRSRVIPHFITATDKQIFLRIFKVAAQLVIRRATISHFNA